MTGSKKEKVLKAIKGNHRAFKELINEEKDKLYRMAYLYVKNESDALDIVQETVYKAYRSKKKVKDTNYFSTWMTRILINNALDFVKNNRQVIPFSKEEMENFQGVSDHQPMERRLELMDALNCLNETYKTVIILRYYKDLTIKQIAEVLGLPEGTVKTNIHRATAQLKKDLKEDSVNETFSI